MLSLADLLAKPSENCCLFSSLDFRKELAAELDRNFATKIKKQQPPFDSKIHVCSDICPLRARGDFQEHSSNFHLHTGLEISYKEKCTKLKGVTHSLARVVTTTSSRRSLKYPRCSIPAQHSTTHSHTLFTCS